MELTRWRSASLKIFSFCLAGLLSLSVIHSAAAEFVFAKTELVIEPAPSSNDSNGPQIIATGPITLQAEIRPASSFQSPSLYIAQGLKVNEAYLIPLPLLPLKEAIDSTPPQHRIEPANVYIGLDLLAVDPQGTIIKIWPELKLSELSAALLLPQTSHAVIYLSSGRAAQLGITPKSRVKHRIFTPPPRSLQ